MDSTQENRCTSGPLASTVPHRRSPGFSVIELLCVMGIIGILLSLLLPAVFGAYNKVRWQAAELEAPAIAGTLLDGSRRYCASTPHYRFETKQDFMDKCVNDSKVRGWIRSSSTQFVPFNFLDPSTNFVVVVTIPIGPRKGPLVYGFTKFDLAVTPEPR